MEELLRNEIIKLKAGEIYVEIGANKNTMLLVHRLADKMVDIYGVGMIDDPCIAGTYYLQGKSQDIADYWFQESDWNLISLLLINDNFVENFAIWRDFVKPGGAIINAQIGIKISL